jgi:hypothetical protein
MSFPILNAGASSRFSRRGFLQAGTLGIGGLTLADMRAILLGAGGAARAVAHGLLARCIGRIVVVNRTFERAEALRQMFGAAVQPARWEELAAALAGAGLLVNTTTLGMVGQPPLEINLRCPASLVVADLVYAPLETGLLKMARARGLRTADGLGMLEYERHTDTRGVVEFSTITTRKQLRIYGPGIVEHEESFDIEPVEGHKTVIVIVKTNAKNPSPTPSAGTIPSSRLLVPDKAQKEFQKGSEALAKKNWVDAKTHFDSAIAIYPDYDVAYNGLGMSMASAGDSKAARPAFEKAIKLNENFAEAYRNLAKISLSERNFEEMNNLLTRSLSADPVLSR